MITPVNHYRATVILSVFLASALGAVLSQSPAAWGDETSFFGQTEIVRIDPKGHRRWRVKEIFIIGNACTPQSFILGQLPFKAGERFSLADLSVAEQRLSRFDFLFVVDRKGGLTPSVQMLDEEEEDLSKDIMIYIKETPAARFYWASLDVGILAATACRQGLAAAAIEANGDHGFMPLLALETMIFGAEKWFRHGRIADNETGGTGYLPEPALLP